MLLDTFYHIVHREHTAPQIKASIAINETHAIFEGHFPGQPVVPGVCMMQIIREITALSVSKKLKITEADNIKFLSVIDPRVNKDIEVDIRYAEAENGLAITASLFAGTVIFFKFKGMLLPA